MSRKALTDQQQVVLDFVSGSIEEHGYPPTLREIGGAVGLANVNAVRGHVSALEKKGYITRSPDKARSIQLVQAPSSVSRMKKRLHDLLGTDQDVFHKIIYGMAWTTRDREPRLTGPAVQRTRKLIEREAVEHGWRVLDLSVQPDHIVAVVETWPNHSASRTVQRLQSACKSVDGRRSTAVSKKRVWGKGYVVTTQLELLDDLVVKLLGSED